MQGGCFLSYLKYFDWPRPCSDLKTDQPGGRNEIASFDEAFSKTRQVSVKSGNVRRVKTDVLE